MYGYDWPCDKDYAINYSTHKMTDGESPQCNN